MFYDVGKRKICRKTRIILLTGFILTLLTLASTLSIAIENICLSSDKTDNNGTGFFQVTQINDRWCFIDPDGNPFFSTGICGISAKGGYAPDLGYSPYHRNIIELYGDNETWANVTHGRMISWGFNTIASGDKYIKATGLPYTLNLGMAGANWVTGEVPDYFSDEWIQRTDRIGREICMNLSEDKLLIGYFLDNELHWGPDWRTLQDLFDDYCNLSYDSPGKTVLVDFLRDRYDNNISMFNIVWGTSFNSFNEILYVSRLGVWPYTVRARNDRAAFIFVVAEQYFKTCRSTIHKYDSNHLILGARFQSYITPWEVVEACGPYVDVVSMNHYPARPLVFPFALIMQDALGFIRPTSFLQDYYDITGKPILISEFYFRAKDSGLPNTKPSRLFMPVVKTQKQRALCYELIIRGFISKPYSVGYHWFAYIDQPYTGRFDGENSNIGVVNVMDEPYQELISRMTIVNNLAQKNVKNL